MPVTEEDDWWNSTAPTVTEIPQQALAPTGDDWWDSTSPKQNYPTIEPTQSEIQDDDYWSSFTSWTKQAPVTRTIGRIPVRASEDIYNALNEVFEFGTRARWEDKIFEEPQSAVEDITAEIGSWLGTFWLPGGVITKVGGSMSKVTGLTAKTTKLTNLISKTSKGKKAVRISKIAAEGALRGAIADYITTDVEDLDNESAIQKRLGATLEGAVIGAGANLTMFGIGRHVGIVWRKLRAIKKVRQASEGKGDPELALRELKKVIEDENKIKDDVLSELKETNEITATPDKELDEVIAKPKPKEEVKDKPTGEKPKVEEPTVVEEPKNPELDIEEYINRAQSLPDQINRMVRLNERVASRLNPKITELMQSLDEGDINRVRTIVSTLETDMRRYRKLMELRAKSGNITGKALRAFAGDPMDFFGKPMVYKTEVLRRMNQVDSLLKLVRDVKQGKLKDDILLKNLKKELSDVEGVIQGKSLSDVLNDSFGKTAEESLNGIWSKYKKTISAGVLKTLEKTTPKNKTALGVFSDRISKTLKDSLANNKALSKKVSSSLADIEDIIANPEKYKESIEKIIKDVTDADNIKATDKAEALKVLGDILKGETGKRLFDVLPNRVKLVSKVIKEELKEIETSLKEAIQEGTEKDLLQKVTQRIADKTELSGSEKEVLLDHVRVQLSNTLAEMRDDVIRKFRSKELFQKFNLRANIRELDEMSEKSIKEIREYLTSKVKENQTPEDIKLLQEEARKSKKVLEDKVKRADIEAENELTKRFLKELSGMQEFDAAAAGTFELMLRTFEKLRLSMMLFSPRTWLVGVPSAAFNIAYQPVQQGLKTFIKARSNPFEEVSRARAWELAKAEVIATSEYFSNFNMFWDLIKETYKNNGQSAILPRAFRRHEEDLIDVGSKSVETEPLKIPFKNRKKLAELVKKYGVKNETNEKGFRKFLLEMVEGEPTTQIGKALDPLFSTSFRAMGVFDEAFKAMGLMRGLKAQALKEGITKNLEEKALNEYVEKRMKEALKDEGGLPQWANNEEFADVEQLALSITYQADYADKYFSQLARSFSSWSRGGDDSHYNPLKIIARLQVPFIKTPTAIAQFALDHFPPTAAAGIIWKTILKKSPLHSKLKTVSKDIETNSLILGTETAEESVKKEAQNTIDDLLKEQEDITLKIKEQEAEAMSNFALGSVMTMGMAYAASTGVITGTGAYLTDEQKKRLTDAGWRPNTIKVGDKRVSFSRLEPWATFLSSMADIVHYVGMTGQHFDQLSDADKTFISAFKASVVENMTNKLFIRGLYETLEVALDKNKSFLDLVRVDLPASLTPSFARDLAKINEQFQREAVEWRARSKERILGIHPGQYRRNLLGEKVDRVWGMDGFWGIISPVTWSNAKSDPLMKELAGLRGKLGQTNIYKRKGIDTRKYYHKRTGQSLYDAWMDKVVNHRGFDGLNLRQKLRNFMKTTEYINAPDIKIEEGDTPKAKLISNLVSNFRTDVWESIEKDNDFRSNYFNVDEESWTTRLSNQTLKTVKLKALTELVGF
jgi:hypothetical protein